MKALLLAAGVSRRLLPLTVDKPKCLLEIGGKTFLEHELDALSTTNVDEVVIVIGHCGNAVRNLIAEVEDNYSFAFKFVENPRYADSNNIYSVWCARDEIRGADFVCVYTDLLFHPAIISDIASADGDIVLLADGDELLPQTMKMILSGDRVETVGRHVTMESGSATYLGVSKFSSAGSLLLLGELERLIDEEKLDQFYTAGVEELIKKGQIVKAVFTQGRPWIEVDLPEEWPDAELVVSKLMIPVAMEQTR